MTLLAVLLAAVPHCQEDLRNPPLHLSQSLFRLECHRRDLCKCILKRFAMVRKFARGLPARAFLAVRPELVWVLDLCYSVFDGDQVPFRSGRIP